MSATTAAVRAGFHRGWIEFRHPLTSPGELLGWIWPSILALIVLYALRGSHVPGAALSVGAHAVPGLLGMNIVFTGMMGIASALTMEREDGTLLRMKATPNGTLGYLLGKVVSCAGMTSAVLLIILVPAAFLFPGLETDAAGVLAFAGVLALGLAAALPMGAVIGSLFRSVQNLGFIMLLIMVLVAVSGVFYPITALPGWMRWIGQAFPIYWLGLGMRSALLPDAMAAVEIGGSWRQLETISVLGAWAVLGFALAPGVLRRMARRTSGSAVAAVARWKAADAAPAGR